MRHLGLLITCFGIIALCTAAPDRARRQIDNDAVARCQQIFNTSCDTIANVVTTLPPLNRNITVNDDTSDCECVQYYQCSLTPVDSNGVIQIDRRFSRCSGIVEVCCKPDFIISDLNAGGTTPPTPGLNRGPEPQPGSRPGPGSGPGPQPGSRPGPGPGPETRPGRGPGPEPGSSPGPRPGTRPPPPDIPVKPGCGHRNSGGVTVRLTGITNEAQFAEFPWMVAVLEKPVPPGKQNQFLCGGSLIHPRAILTAAHNIESKRAADLIIRAGEWDTQIVSEPIRHQEREVQTIVKHDNYNTNNLNYDFAILILKTAFEIAPNVNTICLPEETDTFDAVRCTATGWGKDKFEESGKFQAVLKKLELPVVPRAPCQNSLRSTRLGQGFSLHRSFICAGGEPAVDACTGDGGGPLSCPLANSQNRYVQAGVVSWGIGCGANRTPGVYSNVAKARRWIDRKMIQYNLDTSTYTA